MGSFAEALSTLNDMKKAGILEEYALAGAMAMSFWAEPVPTYDLDVLVFLPGDQTTLVSLAPLYAWTEKQGYAAKAEHVVIKGVAVQFLPAHNRLAEEAIEQAATLDYEGVPVRVVRPEYLAARYLEPGARTLKRRERAAALLESASIDRAAFEALRKRFGLEA